MHRAIERKKPLPRPKQTTLVGIRTALWKRSTGTFFHASPKNTLFVNLLFQTRQTGPVRSQSNPKSSSIEDPTKRTKDRRHTVIHRHCHLCPKSLLSLRQVPFSTSIHKSWRWREELDVHDFLLSRGVHSFWKKKTGLDAVRRAPRRHPPVLPQRCLLIRCMYVFRRDVTEFLNAKGGLISGSPKNLRIYLMLRVPWRSVVLSMSSSAKFITG